MPGEVITADRTARTMAVPADIEVTATPPIARTIHRTMRRAFTPLIRTITTVVIRMRTPARTITDRELALPFLLDTKLLGSARFSAAQSRAAGSAGCDRSHDAGARH